MYCSLEVLHATYIKAYHFDNGDNENTKHIYEPVCILTTVVSV